MEIRRIGAQRAVRFAAGELARYLKAMTGRALSVKAARTYEPGRSGIWVGLAESFGPAVPSAVAERGKGFDDAIFVSARPKHVLIAGANERSVLFAAYRYLEELGCRWLRPGRDGERVPKVPDALSRAVQLQEVPSARHRCICIEGSVSREHVRDTIDYAAKRGFNSYFFQFRNSFTFYDRWYGQERHRGKRVTRITSEEAQKLRDAGKGEALKRGMAVHAVGHAWTCEPLGLPGEEWAPYEGKVPARVGKHFALVGGERKLWGGVPLNTNLCYSSPHVRSIMAQAVVDYAKSHRDEEVIHVWLADGANNNCECASCRKARPSDFYVQTLGEIDERLSAAGLSTRIVFLAYVDLLWAPQVQRIKNPERFILMFAPITRTYDKAFLDQMGGPQEKVGPFRRNKLTFPRSPQANLELLDGWRRGFKGECVDFDYHLMWAHHCDPGGMQLARVLHKDLRDLRKLGMQGFISCQLQRVSFPTGILMHVMGRMLWNARTPFSRMADDYFADVFGKGGPEVRRYLTRMSSLFDPPFIRGEKTGKANLKKALRGFSRIPAHVAAFSGAVERGIKCPEPVTAAAWRLLKEHGWYACAMADILSRIFSKDPSAAESYRELDRELNRRLPRIHHVLDTWLVRSSMRGAMAREGIEFKEPAPGG